MQAYSLDFLLSEVNKVIQKPSSEEIRLSVMQQVRYVLRRIGYDLICDPTEEPIGVVNYRYRIPDDVIEVFDVAYDRKGLSPRGFRVRTGQRMPAKLSYYKSPFELVFQNHETGDFWMSCYKFYTDIDGEILIPEAIYKACYDYAIYEGINVLNNPQHPRWQERPIMLQIAEKSIYEARGMVNEYGPADFRTLNRLF